MLNCKREDVIARKKEGKNMKELTQEQFERIMKETKETGGCTFENFEVVHYSTGYQVATTNNTAIESNISEIRKALEATGGNGGTWLDTSTSELFIDSSHHVNSLAVAIHEGIKHGQRSIWDWSAMDEIKVK